jgi:hypothetical protein
MIVLRSRKLTDRNIIILVLETALANFCLFDNFICYF